MQRDAFLNRIAERLGRPRANIAPARSARGDTGVPESYRRHPLGVSKNSDDLCERFKGELEAVGGRAAIAGSHDEVGAILRTELSHFGQGRLVSWARAEFADWELGWLWQQTDCVAWEGDGPDEEAEARFRRAALHADIGITTADFAVANTGTLVVSASPQRPRSVSLLPTVHLALVRAEQMVDRMGAVLDAYAKRPGGPPSAVHFITGPSRTSDIENDLTIGVHGPAVVSVVVLKEERR
jgi:L-lactate dehydrogenase complex protein LldG